MELLVTYDVSTESAQGRSRLRRVAKVCQGYGQRVQKSVFECVVNSMEMELMIHRLVSIIDLKEDSLRVYRLREPYERHVQLFGKRPEFNLREPLVT